MAAEEDLCPTLIAIFIKGEKKKILIKQILLARLFFPPPFSSHMGILLRKSLIQRNIMSKMSKEENLWLFMTRVLGQAPLVVPSSFWKERKGNFEKKKGTGEQQQRLFFPPDLSRCYFSYEPLTRNKEPLLPGDIWGNADLLTLLYFLPNLSQI